MEKQPRNNEKKSRGAIRTLAQKAIEFFNQPLASHGDHFQKPREVQGEFDLRDKE